MIHVSDIIEVGIKILTMPSLSLYSVGTLLIPNLCNSLSISTYTPPMAHAWGVNITNAQVSDTLKVYL